MVLIKFLLFNFFLSTVYGASTNYKFLPAIDSTVDLEPYAFLWSMDISKQVSNKEDLKNPGKYYVERNEYGFRVTGKEKSTAQSHLILSGCSFTFGEGVNSNETLASYLSDQFKKTNVYTIAAVGGSPADQLYLIKNFKLNSMIKEEEGIFIFNLFFDHFDRISLTWKTLHWTSGLTPVWKLEDDRLVFKGKLEHFFSFKFMQIINFLKLDYLWLRLTSHFRGYELKNSHKLMISFLKQMEKEYLRQYPKGKFLITFPLFVKLLPSDLPAETAIFLNELKKNNINYFLAPTYSNEYRKNNVRYVESFFLKDKHPNALNYKKQAEFISENVKHYLVK